MMTVKPLPGAFGVAIHGLDLTDEIDDQTMRALADQLYANRLIVITGQTCGKGAYLAFGRKWGEPIPHVLDHLRMRGFPEMMEVGNTKENHKQDEIRNGAAFWHTDQSYEAEPSSATMLYAQKVPAVGGETMFADMAAAYDALDAETQSSIDDLQVQHLYGAASGRDGEKIAVPLINESQTAKVPMVTHPLVRRHPVTGQKMLYAIAGTPVAVTGLPAPDSKALLARLKTHALQDRFIYKHKYRIGDIALYDTGATLHSGVVIDFSTSEDTARLLWRISVRGRPRVLQ